MTMTAINTAPQVFSAVFAALYAAHVVGDNWIQTDHQATTKGRPGWPGRLAGARHVATLTLTQLLAVLLLVPALGVQLSWPHLAAGLSVNAVSHWWADRRSTLAALAELLPGNRGAFYRLGQPRRNHFLKGSTVGDKPIKVLADDNACLGTGAYHLDQAWHIGWLFVAALLAAGGAR